jgi:hypothetical protein
MTELTLQLDSRASEALQALMAHYGLNSKADLISKALAVLTLTAHIDKTEGELVARKGTHETKIVVR